MLRGSRALFGIRRPRFEYVREAITKAYPGQFSFTENEQTDPPRTGAFEVVLRASPPMVSSSKAEDKTLWSKLQVGEPSSSEPETLRAVSNAILMELRSALNREA
ncbi:hypothetical protein HKI87_19g89040 [Chloropicon roscoffensis]|uniref:Uncharacterized protein n=1 Tax=Chloropicon roscoffensis TaxID=1461544 RepID=A0AAX4PN06_9CHLO